MDRRTVLAAAGWATAAAAFSPSSARAHHGWSSFDTARPIYLEGKAAKVAWRNPHVELDLELAPSLKLPADLAQRTVPAQTANVDGAALLKAAQLPTRRDKRWNIELAPLARMQAWQVAEIKPGDAIAMLGFTFAAEKGEAVLRVEYLWSAGKVYALRSAPV
jgi:Family of unknown function (DUF6152)